MRFNISAFTHAGTVRESNEDNILVNGQLLNEGEVHLKEQDSCFCFVADGVGGHKGGGFASYFILEEIRKQREKLFIEPELFLKYTNKKLIDVTDSNINLKGCCSTLSGLIVRNDFLKIIHAGDSEIWLFRNDMFFKITKDQILNDQDSYSPITSFFGGNETCLKFDSEISITELILDDIFLICSDGLFKSLNIKIVKSILKAGKELETKAKKILENCLQSGAEDNISVIIIHRIN